MLPTGRTFVYGLALILLFLAAGSAQAVIYIHTTTGAVQTVEVEASQIDRMEYAGGGLNIHLLGGGVVTVPLTADQVARILVPAFGASGSRDDYYGLIARHSNKGLDVTKAGQDDGTAVIQFNYSYKYNQMWRPISDGGGHYKVLVRHSGKLLTVEGRSSAVGAKIIQWADENTDNQLWRIREHADGYYRFIAKHSGLAMEVAWASLDDGAEVIQNEWTGGERQQWRLQ
jgi:hypothetical protein